MRSIIALLFVISCPLVQAGDLLIPVSSNQRAALRITSAPLINQPGAVAVALPATVAVPPAQERVVAAPVPGLLTEVRVAMGDAVKAGQTLAVMRGEGLVSAQRELTQAAVSARLAEDTAARDEALFKEGIIPESRRNASRAALAQARSALMERRAWLRMMGLTGAALAAAEQGDRLTEQVALVAPISGVVVAQSAVTGARVDASLALFRIARLDPLWLDIQAPAELAASLKLGQPVDVAELGVSGKVISIGQVVGAAQTVQVRARVTNAGARLRLNQSVSVRIESASGGKQWRVPARALARQAGQSWVFVERPGGFEPVAVKIRSQTAQTVAIDGPFGGGEKVAIEGVAALKSAWQGAGE
ncbi:MAG: efflux RND transporter periplasmic adaptor subunit [Pseudomonadota bacterium]